MTRTKAMLSLTCASIIVGTTLVVSRIISEGGSIYFLQFLSMLLASLVLYFWIGKKPLKEALKGISKKDYIYLSIQSLTGVVLFRVLIVYGLKLTRAMDAGIILSLVPVITVLMAMVFLGERLNKKEWLAVILAFIGVLVINLSGIEASGNGSMPLLGNFLVLIAAISEGAFAIFSKKVSADIPALVKSFIASVFSTILFLPLGLIELMQKQSFLYQIDFWLLVLYTGLVLTVLAYIFWFSGVPHVSGSTAGIFNTLIPVSSIVMVALIFNERLSQAQLLGLGLVMAGVVLMSVPALSLVPKVRA